VGAVVRIQLRERGQVPRAPPALQALRILSCDPEVIAIDKPAGVLAQEGQAGGPDLQALVSALLASRGEPAQALLVHRLDRGTTGVTLLARSRAAQAWLLAAFREGRVEKSYRALCAGRPAFAERTVDEPVGPDPASPGRQRVDPAGAEAHTRLEVLRTWPSGYAEVLARPTTGRTHQIRVHLAWLGLPLLGDGRYGGPALVTASDGTRLDAARPLLHAERVSVERPGGARLIVEAPLPEDFLRATLFLDRGY
jgi:23S rRNA pseudouridine1911/1915/1917 synthase